MKSLERKGDFFLWWKTLLTFVEIKGLETKKIVQRTDDTGRQSASSFLRTLASVAQQATIADIATTDDKVYCKRDGKSWVTDDKVYNEMEEIGTKLGRVLLNMTKNFTRLEKKQGILNTKLEKLADLFGE